MRTSELWKDKSDCCGCELCASSCPNQVIQMCEDEEGFLYPFIEDDSNCINCKRCIIVCPIKKPGRKAVHIENGFSYSLPEEADLKRSSSGGMATAVGRAFIQQGGIVYGVAYTNGYKSIRYQRASTITELERFRGSKYAQAIKNVVYKEIKKDIEEGKNVLFIGLPCEVSAVYHAVVKQDKLYTISLICHGPTSQKVHNDYLESLPESSNKIVDFTVRYKRTGWKPYFIHVEYENGSEYEEQWNKSDYGIAFQYLKRPSCQICRYKTKNSVFGLQSDMTVGDYHAIRKDNPLFNKWGVSQVCVQTEKGRYLANLLEYDCQKAEIPLSILMNANKALHQPIPHRGNKKHFMKDYKGHTLHFATHSLMVKVSEMIYRIQLKLNKIKNIKKIPQKFIQMIMK